MANIKNIIAVLVVIIFSLSVVLGNSVYYSKQGSSTSMTAEHCQGMLVAQSDNSSNKNVPVGCCHKGCVMAMCGSFVAVSPGFVIASSQLVLFSYLVPESQTVISFITDVPFNPPKQIS